MQGFFLTRGYLGQGGDGISCDREERIDTLAL
jgi:hypothetical protein